MSEVRFDASEFEALSRAFQHQLISNELLPRIVREIDRLLPR